MAFFKTGRVIISLVGVILAATAVTLAALEISAIRAERTPIQTTGITTSVNGATTASPPAGTTQRSVTTAYATSSPSAESSATQDATAETTALSTTQATTKATAKPTPTPKPAMIQVTTIQTTTVPTTTAPTAPTTTADPHPYKGTIWYAIGDSITERRLYPNILIPLMQFASCKIDGYGGRLMTTMGDRVNREVLADVKLVTVFGGTNDYAKNVPLGASGDAATTDTFHGQIQKVIDKIRVAKPDADIVFLTPIKRGDYSIDQPVYPEPNDIGVTLEQYVQAIHDVCRQNSVRVVDLFNDSGIEVSNLDLYTSDNLHPNDAGSQKIAEAIQRALEP